MVCDHQTPLSMKFSKQQYWGGSPFPFAGDLRDSGIIPKAAALHSYSLPLEKPIRVPWAARRSNQSIVKKINPEFSLEGLMLKLQSFGHLMWRANSLEKTLQLESLRAGGEGDDRGWDAWMASPTHWTCVWAHSWRWWRTGKPGVLQSVGSERVRHGWVNSKSMFFINSNEAVWYMVNHPFSDS